MHIYAPSPSLSLFHLCVCFCLALLLTRDHASKPQRVQLNGFFFFFYFFFLILVRSMFHGGRWCCVFIFFCLSFLFMNIHHPLSPCPPLLSQCMCVCVCVCVCGFFSPLREKKTVLRVVSQDVAFEARRFPPPPSSLLRFHFSLFFERLLRTALQCIMWGRE